MWRRLANVLRRPTALLKPPPSPRFSFPTSARPAAAQQAAIFVARLTLRVHVGAVLHEHKQRAVANIRVWRRTRCLVLARAACNSVMRVGGKCWRRNTNLHWWRCFVVRL